MGLEGALAVGLEGGSALGYLDFGDGGLILTPTCDAGAFGSPGAKIPGTPELFNLTCP